MRKVGGLIPLIAALIFAGIVWTVGRDSLIMEIGIQGYRTAQTASAGAVCGAGGYVLFGLVKRWLARRKMADKERMIKQRERLAESGKLVSPLHRLHMAVEMYIEGENANHYFRGKLEAMLEYYITVSEQVGDIRRLIANRFGEDTMSYTQFMTPVNRTLDDLLTLGLDLVEKLEMFEAPRYDSVIARGEDNGEYASIAESYKQFASSVVDGFEKASLKLAKLIIEIGRLKKEDLLNLLAGLDDLDGVIRNARLYE